MEDHGLGKRERALKSVDLSPPAGIRCEMRTTGPYGTAVVSVAGEVPRGSGGSDHAGYIAWCALTALHRSEASYLVLDFRDMGYVMGNSMLGVFQEVSTWQEARGGGASPYSISVVTSDRCHDGLLTLVTPPPYEKPKWFFEDLESALEAIALDDAQRDPD